MNDLFIGSGGFTGIKFIGALEYLHTNKMLDLKNFYGCSIGSLIGILYISGYKPIDILEMFNDFDLKSLTSFDLNNVKKNYIIDNKLLDSLLKPLLDKYEKQITLKDFSVKTGVNINIICTDITNMKCINFNNVSNPDIKLTDAIKASMTVPFIFEPVKIGNTEYRIPLYEFNYKNTLGLDYTSRFRGIMAQDLLKTNMSKAVILNNNGYYSIDYNQLNINLEKIS